MSDHDGNDDATDLERAVYGNETSAQSASRILRENGVRSAMSIVHLASRASNERVRLQAAQYVVEHTFLASQLGLDTLNADEQMRVMGNALSQVVESLGHDLEDPNVRESVHAALVSLSKAQG